MEPDTETGARIVLDALRATDVELVFGYPGGAIMPLYDALLDSPIRHVLTRHEQAAIHAADGYARASGRLGVCITTSGPGATNLVTGICTAMMDSSPVLCLTGQVNTPTIGTDAFQEADVMGIVSTVTKQAFLVRSLHELPDLLAEAIYVARSGRPGPVVVDLPKNVLTGRTSRKYHAMSELPGYEPVTELDEKLLGRAHEMLSRAQRPVCIIGGGCKLSGATKAFRRWCERTQVPVVATLNGIGAADPEYAGLLGMLGMHGLKRANQAVVGADLLIALGMRFDDRVTGRLDDFGRNAKIIHIDIDVAEINKIVGVDVGIAADLGTALDAWCELLKREPVAPFSAWQQEAMRGETGLQVVGDDDREHVSAVDVLDSMFDIIPPDTIVTSDVGQHQMWTAQRFRPANARQLITSGGAGTMGTALPFAIGAQFMRPTRSVVCVVGDGGFQMSLPELATVARCKLPLKILVLDNRYLGMVRQWQEILFDQRYSGVDMSDNPDFAALARVYGIAARTLATRESIDTELEQWWRADGPALLHCRCQMEESVFPMVPANAGLAEMLEETR